MGQGFQPGHLRMSNAAQDSRVTVIHQENGGIAKAQNTGLDAAHGEYIAFSDNDDILDRRNIEYLLHALQNTGADMSKARWRQFGVSQLSEVSKEAETGAQAPGKITVFRAPARRLPDRVLQKPATARQQARPQHRGPLLQRGELVPPIQARTMGRPAVPGGPLRAGHPYGRPPCTPAWARWPTSIACSITGFRSPTR